MVHERLKTGLAGLARLLFPVLHYGNREHRSNDLQVPDGCLIPHRLTIGRQATEKTVHVA